MLDALIPGSVEVSTETLVLGDKGLWPHQVNGTKSTSRGSLRPPLESGDTTPIHSEDG